ncbi:MAG: ABC transporter permease [Planctomycetota bacterium]
MQIPALIVDSFRESLDRKIFWVMLAVSLVVAAAMSCVGFAPGMVDVFFGSWRIETDVFTVGGELRTDLIATVAVDYILDTVVGSIGTILALIATAGFFPAMLERGAIEVVLSKPIARWKLFLGRYFGAMMFVLVHATVFVASTFLVLGLRWGTWMPAYLLCIPLMVLLFSYLYCVSALAAVWSRSATAAIVLSLGAWVFFAGVQGIDDCFILYPKLAEHQRGHVLATTARWMVPKTQDLIYNAKRWTRAAGGMELVPASASATADPELLRGAARVEQARLEIPAYQTIGSSLLSEAAIVLLAMWKFSRRDY